MTTKDEAQTRLYGELTDIIQQSPQDAIDKGISAAERYAQAAVEEAQSRHDEEVQVAYVKGREDGRSKALADTLGLLELLVGPLMWDAMKRTFHDKAHKEHTVEIVRGTLDSSRTALRYYIDDRRCSRAEAEALLLESEAKG